MNIFLEYILFLMIIVFIHLFAYNTQAMSGNKYFYGVYVNQIELNKEKKLNINNHFKKSLNLSLIFDVLIYFITEYIRLVNTGLNIILCIIIYILLYYYLLKIEYKKVNKIKEEYLLDHKIEKLTKNYTIEDEILTNEKIKIKRKFIILFSICIGISLLSLFYVISKYNSLPDKIITHWGVSGKADIFSEKNIINVFFTNFIDILMVILFAFLGIGSLSSKIYINKNKIEVNRRKAIKYLNGIGYSFLALTLVMQSLTSTIPIYMVNQKNIPLGLTAFSCIVPIFLVVPLIYFYIMLNGLKTNDKSIYRVEDDDEKWIYGFIYYNKEDPSFMVEKRLGVGWSINMAAPLGKLLTWIIIIITVGSIVICFV